MRKTESKPWWMQNSDHETKVRWHYKSDHGGASLCMKVGSGAMMFVKGTHWPVTYVVRDDETLHLISWWQHIPVMSGYDNGIKMKEKWPLN